MSIQYICIIILGGISLLALFDLRKKTKELDGLKCKFDKEPITKNQAEINNIQTIILQINNLKKQMNIMFTLIIFAIAFLIILTSKIYVKTYNIQDMPGYKSFEYTEQNTK